MIREFEEVFWEISDLLPRTENRDDIFKVIESIYDSVGSCINCQWYKHRSDNHGICTINRDTDQALWVNIEVDEDWYCKDFIEKTKREM
jgi:hypothetical protein